MPDTARPINRHPPGLSQDSIKALVSMPSKPYDTSSVVHSRSPSQPTPAASSAAFPQRSPRRSSANAAWGGLTPVPAYRCRRTYLHLHSSTTTATSVFYIHTSQSPSGHTNAVAESFFATYKKELIHTRPWNNLTEVTQHTFLWIEGYYNRRRRHSTLRYLTPEEYELGFRDITQLAA
jgi:hypothetical protein